LCKKCYYKWFKISKKKTCPLCRQKVFQKEEEENIQKDEYYSRFTKYVFDDENN
jgi:hypothetical protein